MAGNSEAPEDDYLSPQKAAKSKRLHDITEEVCQWLSQTLNVEITHENFMEKLETGVELCRLQNKLCVTLGGQEIEYHDDAEKHPQFARQNIEHFFKWCKDLGCHQLFEPNDLVIRKGMLNETREQADQNKKRRCKSVILCLHQLKKKYDTVMDNKREGEAKASEGEEKENLTAMMVDETDSSNTITITQAQETDHNQSDDATQSFDTPPPESDNEDEEKESSDIEETAPGESNSTAPGSNESSRVKEDEKKKRGETTPKPATAVQSSNSPPVIRDYFYPVLFLCILPLVFMVGFYYLKRRK